ncbi:hypothetical protein HETIRDRAFT_473671 [Heterobasidion irregulare TC 32-1]|uniref:Uncharacterized protein n=1 Tax=Heterobasidion irregulare (strain TC 32-1) TaxID=747525 RepID=W4K9K9_HETIT|nr:uncharacterized protein HETIRDRAFT_473671 [Heterobasidion irregulare TC 32-1]ETW82424.1 hypothetical protein HETIRDRAFT_473671 [Heterobasidion irregulare TC 32-1]
MHVPSPVTDICGHPLDLMHTHPSPQRHAPPLPSALTSVPFLHHCPDPTYTCPLECIPAHHSALWLVSSTPCKLVPSIPPHGSLPMSINLPPSSLAC